MINSESVPSVNSCCHCLSLRKGSLIIGYYYEIVAVLSIVSFLPISLKFLGSLFHDAMIARLLILEYYILLFIFGCCAIHMVSGIKKKLPERVRPFLIWGVVFIINQIVLTLLFSLFLGRDVDQIFKPFGYGYVFLLGNPIVQLIDILIAVYLLVVVNSYYKELKDEVGNAGPTV